jgi:SAM-dependent methyltransferase
MGLTTRIRNYVDIYHYHRERSTTFAEHDFGDVYQTTRSRVETALGRPAQGLRMLDVGCGQRIPATLLFARAGNAVTGIDTELVVTGPGPGSFFRVWRSDGLERAAKTLFRQLVFDPAYYRRLGELFGSPLSRRGIDVRQLSVTEPLPFPAASFDVVISNAVFEHVADVPAAIEEVVRLLRPGGVCHIAIHLFPSLSGGHHMRWAFPDTEPPDDIPPWDHLRDNRFPAHVYLNRLVEREYREAFESTPGIEIVDWVVTRTEGEQLLTAEIEAELTPRYSRDDLLRREVVVIGRRSSGDQSSS